MQASSDFCLTCITLQDEFLTCLQAGNTPTFELFASDHREHEVVLREAFQRLTHIHRVVCPVAFDRPMLRATPEIEEKLPLPRCNSGREVCSVEQFTSSLIELELVTAATVEACLRTLPGGNRVAMSLAAVLVRDGHLTKFQADAALDGKGEQLVFGEYVVISALGAGGMGQVYKARHRKLNRIAAIKVIHPNATASPDALRRFQREVLVAGQLAHPNIVAAYDASEVRGSLYLAMEFVEGHDLEQCIVKSGPLSPEQALKLVIQAATGLAYAHSQGCIHRDIKPSNLLLDNSEIVKVLDLGIARINDPLEMAEGRKSLTNPGHIVGTIDFMSPEQALNPQNVDARSDIYSLGCTLYFLLTGMKLYRGDTVTQILLAHREQEIPSLAELRGDLPQGLEEAYRKMVAKRPEDRFQSMDEVKTALLSCEIGVRWDQNVVNAQVSELAVTDDLGTASSVKRRLKTYARIFERRTSQIVAVTFLIVAIFFGAVVIIKNRRGEEVGRMTVPNEGSIEVRQSRPKVLPKKSQKTPLPAATDTSNWIDVMSQIDIDRDPLFGSWRKHDGKLEPIPIDFCRTSTRYRPEGSYEVELKFRWLDRVDEANLILPVGKKAVMVSMARVGMNPVQNTQFPFPTKFFNNQTYCFRAQVILEGDRATVLSYVNDQPAAKWDGALGEIGRMRSDWMVPGNTIGFGVHNAVTVFESFRLKPLSGKLWWDTVEPGPSLMPMKWVDLLERVEVTDHVIRGPWRREGKSLSVDGGDFSRIVLPVAPRGSYELSVKFERVGNTPEVNLFLPVGNSLCMFSIKSDKESLQNVVGETPAELFREPDRGKEVEVDVKVTLNGDQAEISVDVDRRPSIRWKGSERSVQCRFDWLLHPVSLGLGAHDGAAKFRSVQLRVLSGDAPTLKKLSKEVAY